MTTCPGPPCKSLRQPVDCEKALGPAAMMEFAAGSIAAAVVQNEPSLGAGIVLRKNPRHSLPVLQVR